MKKKVSVQSNLRWTRDLLLPRLASVEVGVSGVEVEFSKRN